MDAERADYIYINIHLFYYYDYNSGMFIRTDSQNKLWQVFWRSWCYARTKIGVTGFSLKKC